MQTNLHFSFDSKSARFKVHHIYNVLSSAEARTEQMTVSEEQPTMLSEIRVTPVSSLVQSADHGNNQKWLTKKKVEIVTTKNIEKTIQRQLVLEDGRVLDEDVPIVTLDTTENKEMFETDHDETRDNPAYNRRDEMNIGDKVTTLKTTKDVKENVTKTEASQNIGSIASRVSWSRISMGMKKLLVW